MSPFPYEEPELDELQIDYPHLEVHETDNPVIATLLGPDGEPLLEITERRHIEFGYQKG